jgi:1-acyl-sn-glycerol-3-phosphate acyltransferase
MLAAVVRRWLNGLVVVVGLLVALPTVSLTERLRPGSGRRVACTAVRRLLRGCGVLVEVIDVVEVVDEDGPLVGHARGGAVLVPNHASLLDPAALLVALDDAGIAARFVATAGLFRIPLLGGALRAIGTVAIDRKHPAVARRQLAELAASRPGPVVVFPQGAVPKRGEELRFKTGAFALALELGVPVVPVAVAGTEALLPRGRRVTLAPGRIRVRLFSSIATGGQHRRALRDRAEAAVRSALAA